MMMVNKVLIAYLVKVKLNFVQNVINMEENVRNVKEIYNLLTGIANVPKVTIQEI